MNEIKIEIGEIILDGILSIPNNPIGLVVFAHGSGSSRLSKRNQFVAQVLQKGGLATLLFDLLTPEEEKIDQITTELRFNILMLAQRMIQVTDWIKKQKEISELNIGFFGASTGAAAALIAAAERKDVVKAVVSRGGRPDLARNVLAQVQAPTLLIVGGDDVPVIGMNEEALAQLKGEKKLSIIPDATHLFEEAGALEEVSKQALAWFKEYFR